MYDTDQEAIEAERLEQAWTTQLSVNGKLTTLYDFLEENWGGDSLTEKDVRQLFNMKEGEQHHIGEWNIKVIAI